MLAGLRPELTVSLPRPNTAMLLASDVAAPFDDPDEKAAVRYLGLYGDSARPYIPLCMPPAAIGGMFVLPKSTAPASLNLLARVESSFDKTPFRAGEPSVMLSPRYL